jgi:hypothetical protein
MAAVDTAKYVHSPVLEGAHVRFSGRRQHSQPHPRCTSRRRPPGARPRLDAAPPTTPLAARPWLEAASVDSRVRVSHPWPPADHRRREHKEEAPNEDAGRANPLPWRSTLLRGVWFGVLKFNLHCSTFVLFDKKFSIWG